MCSFEVDCSLWQVTMLWFAPLFSPHCSVLFQTKYKTIEPVWEEAFTFLIHNPKSQELEVEVLTPKWHLLNFCRPPVSCQTWDMWAATETLSGLFQVRDEKHECSLGTVTLPLSRLLEAEDMTLNQRFPLKNSGPSCTLKMKVALRVRRQHANDVLQVIVERNIFLCHDINVARCDYLIAVKSLWVKYIVLVLKTFRCNCSFSG